MGWLLTARAFVVIPVASIVAVAVLVVSGCGDSFRKTMKDGFPTSLGFSERVEQMLRFVLVDFYHVPADRADCMVGHARQQGGWPTPTPQMIAQPTDGYWHPPASLT